MIWLLRDFDLLAVFLHAAALAFEALGIGGIFFLLWIADEVDEHSSLCRLLFLAAGGMVLVELANVAVSAAMLTNGSAITWHDLLSASFLRAQILSMGMAASIALLARAHMRALLLLPAGLIMVGSTVWLSHAVARMDHRLLLAVLTAIHHLGTAAWIGAMPYLLLSLRSSRASFEKEAIVRRFSVMALVSVIVLVSAGVGMSWFYIGSFAGLYGTAYGTMLLAKMYLLALMLVLGGSNWYLLRKASAIPEPLLRGLRRFSEVEIGLGFTVLLAAASMTAQPPAADVMDRVTRADYVERMGPQWPRLKSPPLTALAAPTGIDQAIQDQQFKGLSPSDANDRAWSEYNHHWAGLVVFAAGLLALLSRFRRMRWARYWPATFMGLAVFIVLRADPEAWPLGPRPFWATFSSPDVLEHRLAAVLIVFIAVFESLVQAGRIHARWASYVFPTVCAAGGALLLTHGHASGNVKDEVLADASHTMIALLGVTAGWMRWLEIRSPPGRSRAIAGYIWPVALMLVAAVLVDYREA